MLSLRLCVPFLAVVFQTVDAPLASARGLTDDGVMAVSDGVEDLTREQGDSPKLMLSPRATERLAVRDRETQAPLTSDDLERGDERTTTSDGVDRDEVIPGAAPTAPAPRAPSPDAGVVRVAVGLSEDAPGTTVELELVDALESGARASSTPSADVRRLRSGAAVARRVCGEGRDDLVLTIGYLPDRDEVVVFTYDCLLGRELGVRSADAARSEGLLGALWQEHRSAVADGATERRRGRMNPKVRAGLIAGGALVAIGVAVGFVLASTLRDEVTVITVSP